MPRAALSSSACLTRKDGKAMVCDILGVKVGGRGRCLGRTGSPASSP